MVEECPFDQTIIQHVEWLAKGAKIDRTDVLKKVSMRRRAFETSVVDSLVVPPDLQIQRASCYNTRSGVQEGIVVITMLSTSGSPQRGIQAIG